MRLKDREEEAATNFCTTAAESASSVAALVGPWYTGPRRRPSSCHSWPAQEVVACGCRVRGWRMVKGGVVMWKEDPCKLVAETHACFRGQTLRGRHLSRSPPTLPDPPTIFVHKSHKVQVDLLIL